jgi:hypothetical protein
MAKDVALRELDQSGFRISNLGDPKAAGDATKTDNATVPKANSGNGAAGVSLLAAPVDHVHPADGSAGGGAIVCVDDPSYQTVTGVAEDVVFEAFVDLTALPAGEMKVAIGAIVKASVGNAIFNVRLGGSAGQPDGNVVAVLSTNSAAFLGSEVTVFHVANPGTAQLLKITGHADSAAGVAHIYGKSVQLRPQSGA